MKVETGDGAAYTGPNLWLVLGEEEARDLAESLVTYFADERRDDSWHTHIGDELAITIEPAEPPSKIRLGLDGDPL